MYFGKYLDHAPQIGITTWGNKWLLQEEKKLYKKENHLKSI
jgi:hypothetical protein